MAGGTRTKQALWIALAVILLFVAGQFQDPLQQLGKQYELSPPAIARASAEVQLFTLLPGGLRAPMVNYLWIRAQTLKQAGRYYDAKQLAELICQLQPRFDAVWSFHAWNMAWNISVATQTPQERWLWINNGIELLRDKGIPANPKSLMLYNDLAWIFFSRIGGNADDNHMEFKARWAAEMQRLFAAPPVGTTDQAIAAFKLIADSPLDKDLSRQGEQPVQADQLALLLKDAAVADLAGRLGQLDVQIDRSLLEAYNRFSDDPAAASVRVASPAPKDDREKAVAKLVNDPAVAAPLAKLLAFARCQLLWNVYKMDPQYMLQLMVQHNAPLDWRQPWPHAIYWATLGIDKTQTLAGSKVANLNIDRIVLGSLQLMTWYGRLTMRQNIVNPDAPQIFFNADYRFVDPTHQEYLRIIEAILSETPGTAFEDNQLRTGHIIYLENSIGMLVALRRLDQANGYFRFLKDKYKLTGKYYDQTNSVEEFSVLRLQDPEEDLYKVSSIASAQLSASLQAGMVRLTLGDVEGFRRSAAYANLVWQAFMKGARSRLELPSMDEIGASILAGMLVQPWASGYQLTLQDRATLWASIDSVWPGLRPMVYDAIAPILRRQAEIENANFDALFPAPAGLDAYRAKIRQTLPTGAPQGRASPRS